MGALKGMNLKPKHLQRGVYCANCLTANAPHVVGTPIKTLKKKREKISPSLIKSCEAHCSGEKHTLNTVHMPII